MQAPEGRFVSIKQSGVTVSVTATRACDVRESTTVGRTTRSERVNQSAALDWTFGGLGAGLAASGAVILVDSSKVYPNDSSARQYNPLGPTGARVLGASLAAAGLALATVAIVDVVRASGEDVRRELVNVPGAVVERGVRCIGRPLAGAAVLVTLPKERAPFEASVTGPDGKLGFSLDAVVPADTAFRKDSHAELSVAGEPAGTLELASLYSARDEAEWGRLNRPSCATPDTSTACSAVSRYLERYADGAHAQGARALLSEAEPKLVTLRDREQWAKTDAAACAEGKPADVDLKCRVVTLAEASNQSVDCETLVPLDTKQGTVRPYVDCCSTDGPADGFRAACATVREYLRLFPRGDHATDAASAVKNGDAALDKWRKTRTKARKDELAEEGRQQAAEQRREAAEAAEEKRKAAAEEAQRNAQEGRLRAECRDTCGRQCVLSGYNALWCIAECESRCP